MLDLLLKIVLEINLILGKHFDRMINFFESLLLSVDFLVVETKFF